MFAPDDVIEPTPPRSDATTLSCCLPLSPTIDDLNAGLALFERTEALGAFDAVLAVCAARPERTAIVSADSGFADIREIRTSSRIAPGFRRCSRASASAASTWQLSVPAPSSGLPCIAGEALADRDDIDFTYSLTDRVFRLSLGELADFSGAKYDGDFSLSLEQAQRRKHEYVAEQIGIGPGRRVLDLGCGWGAAAGLRPRARRRRASASRCPRRRSPPAAATASTSTCYDARRLDRESFGGFDAVASLGAFEHFCSPEDYRAGRQEEIYRDLFERVASVLPERRALLPADDGLRAQHDPARARSTSTRRATPTLGTSPCWSASSPARGCRSARSRSSRCAEPHFRLVSSVERPPRLHRDDQRSGTRASARAACARRC